MTHTKPSPISVTHANLHQTHQISNPNIGDLPLSIGHNKKKKKKKTTEPENERVDGETEKEEREENFNNEIEGREISGEKGGINFFFLRDNFFFLEYCYSVILILE